MHRFFIGSEKIADTMQIARKNLLWQWNKVLRLKPGAQVVLFNDTHEEAKYKIISITQISANLKNIEKLKPNLPKKEIYLFWSILKKDNNEFIIQKCTELGVSNFVPILSAYTIKKDLNIERNRKIAMEASEQCGRSDIPIVCEPISLEEAIEKYSTKIELFFAQKGEVEAKASGNKIGIFIGPEGGWKEEEIKLFKKSSIRGIDLGDFTLRAETAAIVAVSKLL